MSEYIRDLVDQCVAVAGTGPGQKDAAGDGYTPPAVVGAGKAEDSANEHDDKLSEVSDKASGSAAAEEHSAANAKALEKGKGKMVQGRRTDSASSLRCALHADTCPVSSWNLRAAHRHLLSIFLNREFS